MVYVATPIRGFFLQKFFRIGFYFPHSPKKPMMKRFVLMCLLFPLFSLHMPGQSDSILIDQYELEGVVISAEKREDRIVDVPVSVSLLSSFSVENNRIISSTDLTGPIPNLYMPDYGSKLTSPIYIRGIGSRINSPSIGFYIDEIALFEKAAFHIDFYDVERIEVLRGPQGTLYGRNTMGGIVHVITRDPGNKLGLKIMGEMGNYGHQQYRIMAENPIIRDKMFIQINGNYRTRNGYHVNQFDGLPVDWLNSGGGRIKLFYKPNVHSKLILNIYTDLSSEGGYPYAVVPTENEKLVIDYDHASSYRRGMTGSSLLYERNGRHVRVTSITSFQDLKGLQEIDQDFTPDDLFTVTQDQNQQLLTQEVRIGNTEADSRINWITGIYGFYQLDFQQVGVVYGDEGLSRYRLPYNTYTYEKQNDMVNYGAALFGQGSFNDILFNGFDLTMGLRIDYEKDALDYNYVRYTNGETVPTENFVSGFSFFELLPKVSLNYRWSGNQMSYLSATRGYKSGGFNTTFEREEDRSFNPEYSWNYEFGWKSVFLDKKAHVRLALFYIDWKDLQVYQPIPSGRGSMLKNAASAYSQGAELEVNLLPLKNLRMSGNLGYADVRFSDYAPNPDEEVNYAGNSVPYVPDFTGYLSLSYRVPLNGELFRDLVFSSSWRETGKIYWNDANEYSQHAYGLLGGNVSMGIYDFTLRIWAENILGTDYRAFQFTALGNVYAQPGTPRRIGLTLSYSL